MSRQRKSKSSGSRANTPGNTQVRIIGGQWRGRKLSFPSINGLRPTGDRIRETLFNWIMPDLPGANCLDLFSGSGALGLEALSRGAQRTVLLEFNPQAAKQLSDNLNTLNCSDGQVFHTDTIGWLNKPATERFDIAFLDPPFQQNLWAETLQLLEHNHWLNPGAAIYVETPRGLQLPIPEDWSIHRQKHSGNVSYQLFYKDS